MSGEFGHTGIIRAGLCIDAWGAGPFVITTPDGKSFRFEDSDRFGPMTVTRTGAMAANQPPERSPFWWAHYQWRKQGRRVADDGATCIYEHRVLRPTTFYVKGRVMHVIEEGDFDGPWDGGYVQVKAPATNTADHGSTGSATEPQTP